MKTTITAVLVLFVFQVSAQADRFDWMIGDWKIETKKGTVLESWTKQNDSTYVGCSAFLTPDGQVVPQESLKLKTINGEWYYIPTVSDQNDGQSVFFKLLFNGHEEFIAMNPEHDFPQRIAYRKVGQSIFASIEGMTKGRYVKQNFDYSYVKGN